jgi:hypothetical protein
MIVNGVLMAISLKKAFYDKNKSNLTSLRIGYSLLIKEKRILSFICIFFILGITWSSFLLYIHNVLPFFSYLFIVLNGTQVSFSNILFWTIFIKPILAFLGFTHISLSFLYEHKIRKYDKRTSKTFLIKKFEA